MAVASLLSLFLAGNIEYKTQLSPMILNSVVGFFSFFLFFALKLLRKKRFPSCYGKLNLWVTGTEVRMAILLPERVDSVT